MSTQPLGPDHEGLHVLLRYRQDGVVSRAQLLELGYREHDVRRMLRRREIAVAHPGVYVAHTGPLTWPQREWAAVLATDGVLSHESALPGARRGPVVHVAIDVRRTVHRLPGVRIHRVAGLAERIQARACPPRIRPAEAAVDVAGAARDDMSAFTVLAEALHSRQVSTAEIRQAVFGRARLRRRRLLMDLLSDLETGACSVLERAYLHDVVRAHGLPQGRLQAPGVVEGRSVFRDQRLAAFGLYVELDGRAFHDNPRARDRDLRRDLAAAVDDDSRTVRLGYGQVLGTPCATARDLARLLARLGWAGWATACPRCPPSLTR